MSKLFILFILSQTIVLTSQQTTEKLRIKQGHSQKPELVSLTAGQGQSILFPSQRQVYDIKEQEYFGVKGFSGYVTIDQSTNNKVWFSYIMNKKGIQNAPVVIANPGGPGFQSQFMLIEYGPFQLSTATYKLIENKDDSILDFADFLVPDLPAGNGFSLTDEFPTSNEQAVNQTVHFMNLLSESTLLKDNGINQKTRPLVLWGTSYAGGYFAWLGAKLAKQNWNLKAALFDSPWASARLSNKEFCAAITENNPFKENPKKHVKELCDLTQKCYKQLLKDPKGISAADAFECDEQICMQVGLNIGPGGIEIIQAELGGQSNLDWSLMFSKFFPNAQKKAELQEKELYQNLDLNVYGDEFGQYYQELLDAKVFVSIMSGTYDGCCSVGATEGWMREQKFWNANWESAKWTDTVNGKFKTWPMSEFEIVDKCGHAIFLCKPNGKSLTLAKLRRLTSRDLVFFNGE